MESDVKKKYQRTGNVLCRKMNVLLLPAILTSAATSLNEFVDSLLMSNLLGTQAMSIINLCFCIMLFYATVQFLIGYGGSIIYIKRAGAMQTEEAEKVFYESFWAFTFVGILIAVLGMIFLNGIAHILCNDAALIAPLKVYLVPIILSAPLVIFINSLSYFLPIFGMPNLSMVLVVVANVVNLIMDYSYVRFFHMGVEAAGWATFTGYVVAAILLVVLILIGRCRFKLRFRLFTSVKELGLVLIAGLPQALFQTCFAIQSICFNHVALDMGGESALIAFALQTQIMSMISIALTGIGGTMAEFIAILQAQGDNTGIRYIMRRSMVMMCTITIACFVLLQIWPDCILLIYGIREPEAAEIARLAVRIFSVTYVFRSVSFLMRNYLNASGYDYYAMAISVIDSLVGLFFWSTILIPRFGLVGLWVTYPVNAVVLMCGVLIVNLVLAKRHPERHGILLLQEVPGCLS